ncbi:MAG: ribosome small subunit-dependent GTPase A [Treponema sp.]|nr:ribosome small subunit-dependent GTPase A [Treponema sp.]
MHGLVTGGTNNFFTVECDDGITRLCSIKGKILTAPTRSYNPLAPGDMVAVTADPLDDGKGQICALRTRNNRCIRWNAKGRAPQILAANVDRLIVVTSPTSPPFRPRFVDRALVQAEYENIEPIIVCNKHDLPPPNDVYERMIAVWQSLGYTVLCVSAKTGAGLHKLAALLVGKRSVFIGQSGVGKSSLINALDPRAALRTGCLSEKWQRGSHTTTKGALFHIAIAGTHAAGTARTADIIDTPGVRQFLLYGMSAQAVPLYFRELEPLVGTCGFGLSCTHLTEPGCAVLAAVKNGVVSMERYESYLHIRDEMQTESGKLR